MGSMMRTVSVLSVRADHPPRERNPATMGVPTRSDGAKSRVRMTIDLKLKNGQIGLIEMSPFEATEVAEALLSSAITVLRVNRQARLLDEADKADRKAAGL